MMMAMWRQGVSAAKCARWSLDGEAGRKVIRSPRLETFIAKTVHSVILPVSGDQWRLCRCVM